MLSDCSRSVAVPALTVALRFMAPVSQRVMSPLFELTGPEMVRAPVLLTMIVPAAAVLLMPVTVSVAALLVRLILPLLLLVAVKVPTWLGPPSVWPPTEVVVNRPVLLNAPPPSVMVLPALAVRAPEVLRTVPARAMALVLAPVAVSSTVCAPDAMTMPSVSMSMPTVEPLPAWPVRARLPPVDVTCAPLPVTTTPSLLLAAVLPPVPMRVTVPLPPRSPGRRWRSRRRRRCCRCRRRPAR